MNALNRAETSWGEALPDWVRFLAEQCDATNQKIVAARICYSPALVNRVLGNKYSEGDLSAVEQAVKGAYLNAKVDCPVLGELAAHVCLEKQRQPYAATNAIRVRLYRECRGNCTHSRLRREQ